MAYNTLNVVDDISSGSQGKVIIQIDGKNYNAMMFKNIEAKFDIDYEEVPILGAVTKPKKFNGGSGSFSGTAYMVTSYFRTYIQDYIKNGVMKPFTIAIQQKDSSAQTGSQIVILKNCYLDSVIVGKLDADSAFLDEDVSGTFESYEVASSYTSGKGLVSDGSSLTKF